MGDNLPPNVGAEEISEKKKDCCVGLASRPVMACDVQDSERHDSVQNQNIKKESQTYVDGPSLAAKSGFEKLVPVEDYVPSDNTFVELMKNKHMNDEYDKHFKAIIDFHNANVQQIHNDHAKNKSSGMKTATAADVFYCKQLMLLTRNLDRIFLGLNEKQQQPTPNFTSLRNSSEILPTPSNVSSLLSPSTLPLLLSAITRIPIPLQIPKFLENCSQITCT